MGVLTSFPLADGVPAGKYRPGAPPGSPAVTPPQFAARLTDRICDVTQKLQRIAAEAGVTVVQLTLAWVTNRPGVTSALVGPTRVSQQEENLPAADLQLDENALDRVTRASEECVSG